MFHCLLSLLLLASPLAVPTEEYNPIAREEAVIVQGHARFTVLTDRLIRMEWSQDGVFEDRATLGVVNRRLEVPRFTKRQTKKLLRIETESLSLTYRGDGPFNPENLSVSFKIKESRALWKPGMDDSGNLLGTVRTLDRFDAVTTFGNDGRLTIDPFDKGVVSRDGWAVLDESERHVFTQEGWVAERREGTKLDWYIFAFCV